MSTTIPRWTHPFSSDHGSWASSGLDSTWMGLYTLLVIRMEARNKIERKCFLSVPVIHEPSNLAHVSPSYPIHTCRLSADHPRIIRPPNNRQAQGHYVTDEQCIHTPANMIIHCLRNNYTMLPIHYTLKTLLRTFPCGWNLKIVIYINTPVLVWSRKLSIVGPG